MDYSKYYLFILLAFASCTRPQKTTVEADKFQVLEGTAQGTTLTIKYENITDTDYTNEIQKILKDIDHSLSLWVSNSSLSLFNADSTSSFVILDSNHYFKNVFTLSKEVYTNTNGYFDPSIDPLVEALGFGIEEPGVMHTDSIEFIMQLCSFTNSDVFIKQSLGTTLSIQKKKNTSLNFNAIAQGYAVDVIATFFDSKNIKNYYIEIGGELLVKGTNQKQQAWTVEIVNPVENKEHKQYVIALTDESLATSGSYRNYIEKDGKKYSHTINPHTGMPVTHNLLSVTVKMKSCALADAYATAFMVMGKDQTVNYLATHPDMEEFLIYEENKKLKTYASPEFILESKEK